MLLKIGSILLVILVTGYGMLYVKRNKKRTEVPTNGATSILIGVTTATMGFLLMQTSGNSVTLSIVLSLIYTITCGVLMGGVPYKVKGLNQIIIGFIGATLGSVLGYMTFSSTTAFFVVVLLFLLLVYLILKIFDKQIAIQTSRKKSNKQANKTILYFFCYSCFWFYRTTRCYFTKRKANQCWDYRTATKSRSYVGRRQ